MNAEAPSPISTYFRVCDGVRVRFADTRADLVPWSNNQYLHDLLPNSEIHPLDAGHFAWEQAADEYGRLVVEWVDGGYRKERS